MSKEATDRYNVKVEIPITVILETIFSTDNKDVETLSRWAKHYGFVDIIKDDTTKYGYYKLQDDYNKQDFYIWLDKEERQQYDYENFLADKLDKIEQLLEQYSQNEYYFKYNGKYLKSEIIKDLQAIIESGDSNE